MLRFERAIWIIRRPRHINWWSGYSTIFKLSWYFFPKAIVFLACYSYKKKRLSLLNALAYTPEIKETSRVSIYRSFTVHAILYCCAVPLPSLCFLLIVPKVDIVFCRSISRFCMILIHIPCLCIWNVTRSIFHTSTSFCVNTVRAHFPWSILYEFDYSRE